MPDRARGCCFRCTGFLCLLACFCTSGSFPGVHGRSVRSWSPLIVSGLRYGVRIMSRMQARRVWRLFSLYGVFWPHTYTCTAFAVPCVVGRFCALYGVLWSVMLSSRARDSFRLYSVRLAMVSVADICLYCSIFACMAFLVLYGISVP